MSDTIKYFSEYLHKTFQGKKNPLITWQHSKCRTVQCMENTQKKETTRNI